MTTKQTLRDRYEKKQKTSLDEERLIINEEIDQKLFKTVVDTVSQLQKINFGNMTILDDARDAAVLDVTKVATGDQKKGFMNRVASLFRKDDNPVFDALAFGSAIANFFPQLAKYAEALSTKGGKEVDDSTDLVSLAKDQQHLDAIKNLITKGLRPSGVLAKLGAGWANKYLKGTVDELAEQVIQASLGEIKQVASSVKQATSQVTKVAQAAKDRAEQPQQSSEEATTKIQSAYAKIKDKIGDVDDAKRQVVADVLKALIDQNLLK